jgi:hypothetical protein
MSESAEERARRCVRIDDDWSGLAKSAARLSEEQIAREIRIAEQAARREAFEEAARLVEVAFPYTAKEIRALAEGEKDG